MLDMIVNDAAINLLYCLHATTTVDAVAERGKVGYEVRRDDDDDEGSCSISDMRCNSSDSLQCVNIDTSQFYAQGQQFWNTNAPMHELNDISSLQGFTASTVQSAVFEDLFVHADAGITVGAQEDCYDSAKEIICVLGSGGEVGSCSELAFEHSLSEGSRQ